MMMMLFAENFWMKKNRIMKMEIFVVVVVAAVPLHLTRSILFPVSFRFFFDENDWQGKKLNTKKKGSFISSSITTYVHFDDDNNNWLIFHRILFVCLFFSSVRLHCSFNLFISMYLKIKKKLLLSITIKLIIGKKFQFIEI